MTYTGNHQGNAFIDDACPTLTSVGGNANIRADCPALTSVGGNAFIRADCPALTSVGGDAYIKADCILTSLVSVQGHRLDRDAQWHFRQKVARHILANLDHLDMRDWHCGTLHCAAGWVAVLAKQDGIWPDDCGFYNPATGALILCGPEFARLFFMHRDEDMPLVIRALEVFARDDAARVAGDCRIAAILGEV